MKRILNILLKKDKQYVIRLPYIDGWICNDHYFFHVWDKTQIGYGGKRLNYNKIIYTVTNF